MSYISPASFARKGTDGNDTFFGGFILNNNHSNHNDRIRFFTFFVSATITKELNVPINEMPLSHFSPSENTYINAYSGEVRQVVIR